MEDQYFSETSRELTPDDDTEVIPFTFAVVCAIPAVFVSASTLYRDNNRPAYILMKTAIHILAMMAVSFILAVNIALVIGACFAYQCWSFWSGPNLDKLIDTKVKKAVEAARVEEEAEAAKAKEEAEAIEAKNEAMIKRAQEAMELQIKARVNKAIGPVRVEEEAEAIEAKREVRFTDEVDDGDTQHPMIKKAQEAMKRQIKAGVKIW
ncbi:hypothetical protein F5Y02DRAFT_417470 [Annulohypoxylon stygium]|nr:hypothetical protein F5Y02DRAFT_417470 [Annulohypoxylon stygium]